MAADEKKTIPPVVSTRGVENTHNTCSNRPVGISIVDNNDTIYDDITTARAPSKSWFLSLSKTGLSGAKAASSSAVL